MSIQSTWDKLYKDRIKWAFDATNNCISAINDSEAHHLIKKTQNKEVFVSVYGKSQVGKTTLILKIIGVKNEYVLSLSKLLRGKRLVGDSATATATIFRSSTDDLFWVRTEKNDEQCFNENAIKDYLDTVRNSIEAGPSEYLEKIEIRLPKKYFKEDKKDNLAKINIIDLPGIGSNSIKEHEHVNRVVNKFIPISNLVIIVEAANDIARLKNINIPSINNWTHDPDRFRIVLTHSISARSTKREVEICTDFNKDFFLDIFYRELQSTLGSFFNNNIKVYPLEYGESWTQLREKDIGIYEKSDCCLTLVFNDLINDIINSGSDYSQLVINTRLYNTVNALRREKIAVFFEKIKLKKKEREFYSNRLKRVEKIITILSRKNEEYNKLITNNGNFALEIDVENYIGEAKRSSIRSFINSEFEKYIKTATDSINEFKDNNAHFDIDFIKDTELMNICTNNAHEVIEELENHFFDSYLTGLPFSNWESDCKKCYNILNQTCEEIKQFINSSINSGINKHVSECKKIIEKNDKRKKYIVLIKKDSSEKKSSISEEIKKILKDMHSYNRSAKKDLKTAKKFLEFLKSSFDSEVKSTLKKINSPKNSAEYKCIYVAYLKLIFEEYEKLEAVV